MTSEQRAHLERINAANDSRNCAPAEAPVLYLADGTEKALPTRWVVCPVCDGAGSHVNPAIDCHGISSDEFAEDPDFAEEYAAGTYDQTCNKCQGRTTVQAVDLERLSPPDLKLWFAQLREEAEYESERRAEIRAGA